MPHRVGFFFNQGTLQRDDIKLHRIFSPRKRETYTQGQWRGCRCQRQGLVLMGLKSWFSDAVPRILTNGLPKAPHSLKLMFPTDVSTYTVAP